MQSIPFEKLSKGLCNCIAFMGRGGLVGELLRDEIEFLVHFDVFGEYLLRNCMDFTHPSTTEELTVSTVRLQEV